VPTNEFQIGLALQTAKGTPATAPTYITDVTAADIRPNVERSRREETGQGLDQGDMMTTRIAVQGGFTAIVRRDWIGLLLYAGYGAKAVAGAAAPYTHTFTMASDRPYLTIWRYMFNGANALYERFDDCRISAENFTGAAGGDLAVQASVVGLGFTRLTAKPAGGIYDTSLPIRYPDAVLSRGGVASDAVSQIALNHNLAVNTRQTNRIYDSFSEPGTRSIEATSTEVFQNLENYNKTVYGSGTGTAPSSAVVYEALSYAFKDETGTERLKFAAPRFGYGTAELNGPNANAEIAEYAITGFLNRDPGGGSIVTATLANSVASY
jgi:hypothetical protein